MTMQILFKMYKDHWKKVQCYWLQIVFIIFFFLKFFFLPFSPISPSFPGNAKLVYKGLPNLFKEYAMENYFQNANKITWHDKSVNFNVNKTPDLDILSFSWVIFFFTLPQLGRLMACHVFWLNCALLMVGMMKTSYLHESM